MVSAAPQDAVSGLPNEDRKSSFLAFNYVTFGIGTLMLVLRLYVRFKIRSRGLDDWLMLVAWHMWVVSIIMSTLFSVSGGTKHVFNINPIDIVTLLKYNALVSTFGNLAQAIGKLSVGMLIIRVMERGTSKVHKVIISTFMAIYATMTVVLIIFLFAQCDPSTAFLDIPNSQASSCLVFLNYNIAQSSFGAFLDFFLALSSIAIIWPLTLKLSRKIASCGTLALGVLAGICCAIKTAQLKDQPNSTDLFWDTYDIYMLAETETFLIVVCGCIPTLKPLYDFLAHGTTMTPRNIPFKPSCTSYETRNSSFTPVNLLSESRDQYMLNRYSADTDGTQDPANISGVQYTQSYEVKSHNSF